MATDGGLEAQLEARDPDVRLMLQVRDDVPGAFEVLVGRYQDRLVGLLTHLVGTVADAENLTRDVLLRIYRARKGYKPRARFAIWLFSVAHTQTLVHLRNQGRNQTAANPGPATGPTGLPASRGVARNPATPEPGRPVEPADIVRDALKVLGDDQKVAVLLNKFEAMGYADIARVMDRPEPAIKALLARARTQLREQLEPHFKTGPMAS